MSSPQTKGIAITEPTLTHLRRAREARGLSLRQLAAALDCSQQAPFTWEHGRARPHRKYHAGLRAIFGQPVDALLAPDNENDPEPEPGAAKENANVSPTKNQHDQV